MITKETIEARKSEVLIEIEKVTQQEKQCMMQLEAITKKKFELKGAFNELNKLIKDVDNAIPIAEANK